MALSFRLPATARLHQMTRIAILTAAFIIGLTMIAAAQAPTSRTCFPTCDSTDGRFMALSGTDYNAFAGDVIMLGLGAPGNQTHIEIGIFDGESGGMWDFSVAPLEYTLFADSSGTGVGAVQLHQWLGSEMQDNAWWNFRMENHVSAKAGNGNYVYYLRIRNSDTSIKKTSSFKARSSGTITVKSHQALAIYSPLTKESDARVIYPNYPAVDESRYDGMWKLYLHVPKKSSFLMIWDGDMDHGSFDGSAMDDDDRDTPNDVVPAWATQSAVKEGSATSVWPIRDTTRPNSEIKMSGDPADNNQNIFYRRADAITYEVIDPNGRAFANANPSGNLEWEQFRLDSEPFDASKMDHHVDSLPVGIYQVRVTGMDMGNVNSWRFFNNAAGGAYVELIGVDANGNPVIPVSAEATVIGSASGTVYYDSDQDQIQDPGEPGIPSVTVALTTYYPDGSVKATTSTVTDPDGRYAFTNLDAGAYKIAIDGTTLENDVAATTDADGTATPYSTTFTVTAASSNHLLPFGWRRTHAPGTLTRGYWVNHPEDWPVQTLTLGGMTYTKAEAILVLKQATRGDKTYSMAAQLIATKLNLARGCQASCIGTDVVAADDWLKKYAIGSGRLYPCDWTIGGPIHKKLDDYNNGRLCEGHMD